MNPGYTAPTRVATLVVPGEPMNTQTFKSQLNRLKEACQVRFSDVNLHNSERCLFDPQEYPCGTISYDFVLYRNPHECKALTDIEPWRNLYLAVALVSAESKDPETYTKALNKLEKMYALETLCVVVVFDVPPGHPALDMQGIVCIEKSNYTAVQTALCDLSVLFLNHMGPLTHSRKISAFKSPGLKINDSSETNSEDGSVIGEQKRPSMHPRAKTHIATLSGVSVSRNGSITIGASDRIKSSQSGRTRKFLGNMYLLCGMVPTALVELAEALTVFKSTKDYIWMGSTLEAMGLCLVLQFAAEHTFTPPQILQTIVTDSMESPETQNIALFHELGSLIPYVMSAAIKFYNMTPLKEEDSVPFVMYSQSVLRFASFAANIERAQAWTPMVIERVLSESTRDTVASDSQTKASGGTQVNMPLLAQNWCSSLLTPKLDTVPVSHAVDTLAGICKVYAKLNLERKWRLAAQRLLGILSRNPDYVKKLSTTETERMFFALASSNAPTSFKGRMHLLCARYAQTMGDGALAERCARAALALEDSHLFLSKQEQLQLYQFLLEGTESVLEYWDKNILREIVPNVKPSSSLAAASTAALGDIIHNPFTTESDTKSPLHLVMGRPTAVKVILQNVFAFAVQIYQLFIVDHNHRRVSRIAANITLSPQSLQSCTLVLEPFETGELRIVGCQIQVGGCAKMVCLLSHPRSKLVIERSGRPRAHPKTYEISAQVSPPRPALVLRRTSLEKSWVMLLEGETTEFSLDISNTSPTSCETVHFGFTDSTVETLKEAISLPESTRAEIYEYEYFLFQRPAIKMTSPAKTINAQRTETFSFELTCKRSITSATILIEYGAEGTVRQKLKIPVSITVFPSVEIEHVDLIRLSKNGALKGNVALVLDLRNAWRQTLDVSLSSYIGKKDDIFAEVRHTIEAYKTQRFVVPIQWQTPNPETLGRPIPSLSSAQFVVDRKTSAEALQLFWLREILLEKLSGVWATIPEKHIEPRQGAIELRAIELDKRMLRVLNADSLSLSLRSSAPLKVDQAGILTVDLSNKSHLVKQGILRLYTPSRSSVALTGSMQMPVYVDAKSETAIEFEVIPLSRGILEFVVFFDIVGGGHVSGGPSKFRVE